MKVELIKIKYLNPLIKVREHHIRCNFDHYKKEFRGCTCIEKQYRSTYNTKIELKRFEVLQGNSKKYSLVCKVDGIYYYCYNLNEMFDLGYLPIEVKFIDDSFLWQVEGVNGNYKSQNYFEILKS